MDGLAGFAIPEGQGTVQLYQIPDGSRRLHVRLSGAVTELALAALRRLEPGVEHGLVTRYDVAVDGTLTDESYEDLARLVADVAMSAGFDGRPVSTSVAGDWIGGRDGRTLYVGAPSSSVRARFYEKGIQLGSSDSWVRLEWQVRPAASTPLSALSLRPPSGRYAEILRIVAGLTEIPDVLRRVDRDPVRGGLPWLERTAVAMLRRVDADTREQWLRRLSSTVW